MERILTVSQMTNADKYTIEKLGVPKETLMERAGFAVAEEIKKRFPGGRVLICLGKGNNGKDGEIIYKILSNSHGFSVLSLNVSNGIFKMFEKKFDIIVDCIFGTGLNREIEGKYKNAIDLINNSGSFVVSCDIPSGLNGDTGLIMGACVKANLTVAIQEYKLGHFLNDGPDFSGEIVVKDIGISVWDDLFIEKINDDDASKFFPKRKKNVNKGSFGKSAIIAGSKMYSGSALLSFNALCVLKTGAGYSNLCVPESLLHSYIGLNPECLLTPIKDKNGYILFDKSFLDSLNKYDSIAIGMGLGVSIDVYKTIEYLLKNYSGTLLIDADGLNCLSKFGNDILLNKKCKVVLTPHIAEFSRIVKVSKDIIFNDLIDLSKKFAKKYNVILLVKNAVSVITDGDRIYINTSGNSSLSKCGSGDVLSGLTAGLLSRKDDVLDLVTLSSYLFGKAAELASSCFNEYTVTASEVISKLPEVINSF